jgi:hypothetical protein
VKAEVKEQWVAALRSGDYKKGQNYLRQKGPKQDAYCCLGVLCELAVKAGVASPATGDDGDGYYTYEDGSYAFPPDSVVEWAGLDESDPEYKTNNGHGNSLSNDNDDRGFSFNKIADRIERYL